METIKTIEDLKKAINHLEIRQDLEEAELREQFHIAYESVKPINIIKNSLIDASEDSDIKHTILNSSVGITSGLLSSFLLKGIIKSPIKRLIGSAIIYGITNYAAKHPEKVKSIGSTVVNLFKKKSNIISEEKIVSK